MRAAHYWFEKAKKTLEHYTTVPREEVGDVMASSLILGDWAFHGFPTYRLTPAIVMLFAATDTSKIELDEYPPPYPTIFCEFDAPGVGGFPIAGAFCMLQKKEGQGWGLTQFMLVNRESDSSYEGYVAAPSHYSRDRWGSVGSLTEIVPDPAYAGDDANVREACHIVLNAILYLNSDEAANLPREPRSASSFSRRKRELPRAWIIGDDIKPLLRSGSGSLHPSLPTRTIAKQSCTRGHWKHQPHGPRNTLRKLIWIRPYWRGPNAAEAIARLGRDAADRSEPKVRS